MADKVNLTKSLDELEKIADWFDSQESVDVEEGLNKVREAAKLIKSSKARLTEIENEFQEIEKEIADDEETEEPARPAKKAGENVSLDDIPF